MSGETFDAGWLALREPVDHRSRPVELAERLSAWWADGRHTRVVDLGCGTGSNLRWLAPRLGGRQRWLLLDHDPRLLARITPPRDMPAAELDLESVPADLTDGVADRIGSADLVTASALLDLVSRTWLEEVADACVRAGAAALFPLSYDGSIEWSEPDADDGLVLAAVNRHQTRDKGFGPALGPHAAAAAAHAFERRGLRVRSVASPWCLGDADRDLARLLIDGWAAAAGDVRPHETARIRAWAERRTATIARGDFGLTVGHVDVLAMP